MVLIKGVEMHSPVSCVDCHEEYWQVEVLLGHQHLWEGECRVNLEYTWELVQ